MDNQGRIYLSDLYTYTSKILSLSLSYSFFRRHPSSFDPLWPHQRYYMIQTVTWLGHGIITGIYKHGSITSWRIHDDFTVFCFFFCDWIGFLLFENWRAGCVTSTTVNPIRMVLLLTLYKYLVNRLYKHVLPLLTWCLWMYINLLIVDYWLILSL